LLPKLAATSVLAVEAQNPHVFAPHSPSASVEWSPLSVSDAMHFFDADA